MFLRLINFCRVVIIIIINQLRYRERGAHGFESVKRHLFLIHAPPVIALYTR